MSLRSYISIFQNFTFREHKSSMMRLKKILSDASKNRRSRRNILSIQITILGWLVELLGFLTLAIGSFILGHENSNVTMIMQVITMIWYAILLPCTILVNSSEVKDRIAESQLYQALFHMFGCVTYSTSDDEDDDGTNETIDN